MRLTVRTNIAMRVLMYCACNDGGLMRSADIADACNCSPNHVAQVVNQLGAQGFLMTQRGRGGGLQLARPANEITVGEVFRGFEAQLPVTECFDIQENTCPLSSACRLREALSTAMEAFYAALDRVTLAELVVDNTDMLRLFQTLDPLCGDRAHRVRAAAQ